MEMRYLAVDSIESAAASASDAAAAAADDDDDPWLAAIKSLCGALNDDRAGI